MEITCLNTEETYKFNNYGTEAVLIKPKYYPAPRILLSTHQEDQHLVELEKRNPMRLIPKADFQKIMNGRKPVEELIKDEKKKVTDVWDKKEIPRLRLT